MDISVVIPIFLNESSIEELSSRLKASLKGISSHFEIIFVDDGSPDDSWKVIKRLAKNDKRISGLRFSRTICSEQSRNGRQSDGPCFLPRFKVL